MWPCAFQVLVFQGVGFKVTISEVFVVTRGAEIGLNVVGKGPRVNQHPPIQPQSSHEAC
jgi:hypothetical protein